jgi:hypothetical protein
MVLDEQFDSWGGSSALFMIASAPRRSGVDALEKSGIEAFFWRSPVLCRRGPRSGGAMGIARGPLVFGSFRTRPPAPERSGLWVVGLSVLKGGSSQLAWGNRS